MIYECDQCEAVLGPGLVCCPRCGQPFDDPVPADAILEEVETPAAEIVPMVFLPLAEPLVAERSHDSPPDAEPVRRIAPRKMRWLASAVGVIALLGLGGVVFWHYALSPRPAANAVPDAPASSALPTDLAAHPLYAAHMNAFVRKLRSTGVGAEWPAFGSNDVLLITPPRLVDGQRADWDKDTCQRLGQGIYGYFALYRHEAGFSDTDATTCFVIVSDTSGQVVAADLMGNVE